MGNSVKQFSTSATKGDLFKYQNQLPKLPVPSLEETAAKYLRSVTPFLSPDQLAATKAKVEEFVRPGGVGSTLQLRLEQHASGQENWLAAWWDDWAYMSYRDPVVPYVSYFFSHKDINNVIGKDQLYKATLLAHYTLQFMVEVQQETLEPEILKGNPYCMNAFHYMFNNSRVPAPGADITKVYPGEEHRYFLVIYKNNFYKVAHHDPATGQLLTKVQLYNQFQLIKNSNLPESEPVGALTSLNRDEYLAAYENLLKSPINAASLESIFASSFVICLDDNYPITIEEKSKNCWHGNGKNRFFDKPLEFFVSANGNSGFLGEHSRMDATPTVQLNNYLIALLQKEDPVAFVDLLKLEQLPSELSPKNLQFDLDPVSRGNIALAVAKFDQTIASHHEEIFQFYGYGKNLIKQFKVSPDAYVQLMMQLAYYKLTGKVRPTYESAATRKFLKGRTETGRSVSIELTAFVKTWSNPSSSIEDKVATFVAAAKQHVGYLVEASNGRGVDRHLFGLKQMIAPGEEIPEIFTDPVYAYSSTWFLSTSQVPSEYFQSWGFSQVIDQGFGLAYLINNEWIHVHISSKRGNGLNSDHLKWYLTEAALEMKDTLSKGLLAPKAKL
ncbi:Carnitine O-acetyltransferase mitochondrial [Scheffersomyces spartinae]|uniref:Carnitine O-acetyltransferase, mitochondrial n=1 Tax=Scheffersomyces spartinae TaxID=45513 RepID=A0A9P7V8G5_9ASCO|nr:Carnitine O-acetyltransferase mitochondrial [Scheffersomyces spartinae]KAG7193316.1 Carnitine O-acetyltransferase mitochondrial [Scheffersomyces spartinae]